jgi:hypothetical protein
MKLIVRMVVAAVAAVLDRALWARSALEVPGGGGGEG